MALLAFIFKNKLTKGADLLKTPVYSYMRASLGDFFNKICTFQSITLELAQIISEPA